MNSSGLPSQLPITMATRIYLSSIILNEAAISSQANNILHIICTPTHICDCPQRHTTQIQNFGVGKFLTNYSPKYFLSYFRQLNM